MDALFFTCLVGVATATVTFAWTRMSFPKEGAWFWAGVTVAASAFICWLFHTYYFAFTNS